MADETEDPFILLRDPEIWPQVLAEAFEYAVDDVRTAKSSMHALLRATREADNATWRRAWTTPFFSQLARTIVSGYLCRYTKDQLTSPFGQNPSTLGTIICSVEILNLALDRTEHISGFERSRLELHILLDILQNDLPKTWHNLWEIREPFLTSEIACTPVWPGMSPSLHSCLIHLAVLSQVELTNRRGIVTNPTTSHTPHLALLFWIHNRGPELRTLAAGRVCTLLESHSWVEFYRSVAHGCTSKEHITAAFLRDLRSEDVSGQDLYSTLSLVFMLRDRLTHAPLVLDTSAELQLVPGIMAAARRELCRGDTSTVWYGDVLYMTFALLKAVFVLPDKEADIPPLSTRQTYALVALIARYVVPLMEGEDSNAGAEYLTGVTARCRTLLRRRSAPESSAELRALARHAHSAWKASTDEIARRRLGPQYPAWRHFLIVWRALGDVLRYDPEGEDAPPVFAALERCGWAECLCSVHKPAHRMRVCKGCWLVAYCGAQCQTRDWEHGGHKTRCTS